MRAYFRSRSDWRSMLAVLHYDHRGTCGAPATASSKSSTASDCVSTASSELAQILGTRKQQDAYVYVQTSGKRSEKGFQGILEETSNHGAHRDLTGKLTGERSGLMAVVYTTQRGNYYARIDQQSGMQE